MVVQRAGTPPTRCPNLEIEPLRGMRAQRARNQHREAHHTLLGICGPTNQ